MSDAIDEFARHADVSIDVRHGHTGWPAMCRARVRWMKNEPMVEGFGATPSEALTAAIAARDARLRAWREEYDRMAAERRPNVVGTGGTIEEAAVDFLRKLYPGHPSVPPEETD